MPLHVAVKTQKETGNEQKAWPGATYRHVDKPVDSFPISSCVTVKTFPEIKKNLPNVGVTSTTLQIPTIWKGAKPKCNFYLLTKNYINGQDTKCDTKIWMGSWHGFCTAHLTGSSVSFLDRKTSHHISVVNRGAVVAAQKGRGLNPTRALVKTLNQPESWPQPWSGFHRPHESHTGAMVRSS